MKLLILKETDPAVESARRRGHEVTALTRREETFFDQNVEILRLADLESGNREILGDRSWDATVAGVGVEASPELIAALRSRTARYIDVIEHPFPGDSVFRASYQEILQETFRSRLTTVRTSVQIGAYEEPMRLAYWLSRIRDGDEVLAPGDPNRQVSVIDVEDIAELCVHLAEQRAEGIYFATGPDKSITLRELLEACRDAVGSRATFTWISRKFLELNTITPLNLPLWRPEPAFAGYEGAGPKSAVYSGLVLRPIQQTITATLERYETDPAAFDDQYVLARDQEADILRRWHALSYPFRKESFV